MIEYDYQLEHDYKDRKQIYTPVYPKKLPNLVCIEGPNSSGKSTLLHLLALSCYGLKTGTLAEPLRRKIEGLRDGPKQKLSFNLAISGRDGSPVLSAEKKPGNPDVVVRDGEGRAISSERFDREFKLIYDIPDNPLDRLPLLLRETQSSQRSLINKIRTLRELCLKIQKDIEEARDPETISRIERDLEDVVNEKGTAERRLVAQRDEFKRVTTFTALKFYEFYTRRLVGLHRDLSEVKNAGKRKQKRSKDLELRYKKLAHQYREKRSELEDAYHLVSPALHEMFSEGPEKEHFLVWREVDVRGEIESPEIRQGLKRESVHFKHVLEERRQQLAASQSLEEARLLKDLIDLLSKYQDISFEIPGACLGVQEFVAVLQTKLDEHRDILAQEEATGEVIRQLDTVSALREELAEKIVPEWKKVSAEEDDEAADDGHDEADEAELIQTKIRRTQRSVDYYKAELAKLNINTTTAANLFPAVVNGRANADLESHSEERLKDRIVQIEADISESQRLLNRHAGNAEYLRKELDAYKNREPHQYQDRAERLKTVIATVQRMETRLNQYDQYIALLIKGRADSSGGDLVRSSYYDHVFEYLGKRVGEVLHVDGLFQVAKVDLFRRVIVTKEGREIALDWMGTGQGQSAYLTGLLGGWDGRMIIALFDEVAMMDSKSLDAVCEKLRELYRADRLLAGVIVQRGEDARTADLLTTGLG